MDMINNFINNFVLQLSSWGLIGGFFLIFLESIIPALPLGVFIGMNMLAFGNVTGFFLSYFSTIIGCMVSFSVFKYVVKDLVLRMLNNKTIEKVEVYMEKIKKLDFNCLVILIALPITPASLINMAAGLAKMDSKKYLLALLIGKLAIVYFWGYIGSSILKDIKNPQVILKMIILVLITYIISKIIEKIIKVEE